MHHPMIGMNATTGQAITGIAARAQRVWRILTTPIGSCVMRRDFGSYLLQLIDSPINAASPMLLRAATALALRRWYPAFRVTQVRLTGAPAAGTLTIHITGYERNAARNALETLAIPIRRAAAATS